MGQIFREKRQYADQLEGTDRDVFASNDIFAIKSHETVNYIREAIYNLISTWNDQTVVLGATVRALRKGEDPVTVQEVSDSDRTISLFSSRTSLWTRSKTPFLQPSTSASNSSRESA